MSDDDLKRREITANIKRNEENVNRYLSSLFSLAVTSDFLIKTKDKALLRVKALRSSDAVFDEFYKKTYGDESLQTIEVRLNTQNNLSYELARSIAGIFAYKTAIMSKTERSKANYDEELRNNIANEAVLRLRLVKYHKETSERRELTSDEPLNYVMHALSSYILEKIQNGYKGKELEKKENNTFLLKSINEMVTSVKAILLLDENRCYGQAFDVLRTLVESYYVFKVIYDSEGAYSRWLDFLKYRFTYEASEWKSVPDGLIKSFEAERNSFNGLPPSLFDYANFGWMDTFPRYHSNPDRKYKFYELAQYSGLTDDENDNYSNIYRFCCQYSHANYDISVIDSDLSNLLVIDAAGTILKDISFEYEKLLEEKLVINGLELLPYLEEKLAEMDERINIVSEEKTKEAQEILNNVAK